MRPRMMIALAVVLAAMATGACYLYLQQAVEGVAADEEYASVVVARTAIPARTPIKREMVEQVELPASAVHPHSLRKLDDAVGKVAQEPLVAGEQVLSDRLVAQGDAKSGLPYRIPPGKRAVTVPVDEVVAVGWHLRPGDHVDVLGTVEVPGKEGRVTVVALQNVEVLAVGKEIEPEREGKQSEVKTVTLAVTLAEARLLVLAGEEGVIRLALRNPVDNEKTAVPPCDIKDLLATGAAAAAVGAGGSR
ncbi:MAG: pilus assembly protein CpaB [Clostridia bacterium]|nr:pilus assembly protein CpaB [Clostridia bacterium]MDN5375577.1 pilus assembly protein CpaB [Thermacetogenium sp.]